MPIHYLRFSGINAQEHIDRAILICNSTRIYNIDGTKAADITRAEIEGRKQLRDLVRTCRAYCQGLSIAF